ncbi:MAG: hypothetical protein RLN70_02720 [Rhodospirillaceae bacterium]
MNRKQILLSILIFGVAAYAVAAWYGTRSVPAVPAVSVTPEQTDALVRDYSPILGPEKAPVTIV